MKLKRTLLTAGLVAASTVGLALSGRVQAVVGGPTCNVPADYAIIQLAVDDVGCSTIKVASGTYPENVTIARNLTLKGAKAGVNVNGRTAAGPNESTVSGTVTDSPSITVNAADVTIDGFSVTNTNHGLGIVVKTVGNNAVIKNNIVDDIGSTTYISNTVGIYLETGPDNVKVEKNKISNVQSIPSAHGILVGNSTSINPSLGVRIDSNKISDITSVSNGAYGVQLNNGAFVTTLPRGYTTGMITSNDISNLTGGDWAHGIGLEGDTPNLIVKLNTIKNLIDQTTTPFNNVVGVTLESNLFFFTVDVNQNSLDLGSTAFGIAVQPAFTTLYPTLSVDGTCNWWGNKTGPGPGTGSVGTGTGSMVTLGVDYKPWLKSAKLGKSKCGDKGHSDYNNHSYGHGRDDKDRWDDWNDWGEL